MRTLFVAAAALLASAAALAQSAPIPGVDVPGVFAEQGDVVICPAEASATVPPAFDDPQCRTGSIIDIDPQGRMIWVRARIVVPPELAAADVPLGVFVLAKASSVVWLDGVRLGANGAPAATRAEEAAGRMDAVLPVPPGVVRTGDNELILLMSSHRGYLHLFNPVHALMLGRYTDPQDRALRARWPALVPFGAFLIGGIYFTVAGLRGEDRRASMFLALISFFAAGQVFAEVSRALVAYAYPIHDLRLIAIFLCSLGFGLCLTAQVVWTYEERRPAALFAAIAAAAVLAAALSPGFDGKSLMAMFVPALGCAAATGLWTYERKPGAALHFAALAAFAVVSITAKNLFLDVIFFYVVAAFLLVLLAAQALALADERRLRRQEAERASRLALVLEQRRDAERPERLSIPSAGRIELVDVDQIVSCRGAGDYVEICLADGRERLHSASLNELETDLPATFLRVHRSHIVNTAFVRMLRREPSGVGLLVLTTGDEIPVSRRIMPKVRDALG